MAPPDTTSHANTTGDNRLLLDGGERDQGDDSLTRIQDLLGLQSVLSDLVSPAVPPDVDVARSARAQGAAPTFYEFFAGAGMVRLGLGPDWTCLLANDNDVDKATSYARNFSVRDLKIDDVACLTVADLPGHADLAWSSFPCQDLSLAGGRAGLDGSRSATFWSFWGLMMALRAAGRAPRLVTIENVCGLITAHGGKDFVALCEAFTEGGYRVGAMVIDAELFVP